MKVSSPIAVELVKSALKETKNILTEIDEDGLMYAQMWEIFRIFSAKQHSEEDYESSVQESNASRHY